LREKVEKNRLRRIPVTNAFLEGDPELHAVKTLTVEYSVGGRRKTKNAGENETLKF
jgi:hypothetical protein